MKIAIASDHGGFQLKKEVVSFLLAGGYELLDFGCDQPVSCNYADYAVLACNAVTSGQARFAVLICGTGIGMSMAANKLKGIRAAVCSDTYSAKYTRLHNDANVLCMGERVVGSGLALEIADIFLHTDFEGGRHQARIDLISALER